MTAELRGTTWDHPRGYAPLDTLARLDARSGPRGPYPYEAVRRPLRWERRSIEDFESRPLAALTPDYDVLVVDQAGLGTAVADGCLLPMDDLFAASELAEWRDGAVGASYDGYVVDGRPWALPIDATAQVAAARREFASALPGTWAEVRELARSLPVTLCLGGPHAFLTFCALCVAQGAEPFRYEGAVVPPDAGEAALDTMAELVARCDSEVWRRGPAGLLEALAAGEGPAYCPLVHGYVTYAGDLRYADAPAWEPGGRPGSVLGGAGLAVSRSRAADPAVRDAIRDHLRRLCSPAVQRDLYPAAGGQPAARATWTDAEASALSGGFYRATLATLEAAWVRPASAGYVPFQAAASRLLRDGAAHRVPPRALLHDLDTLYHSWRCS
jgi:multiple sugar transport system substrate-binding protein